MAALPSIDVVIENLLSLRREVSRQHVTEGRTWYSRMADFIRDTAEESAEHTGDTPDMSLAVGVFCAFSQNSGWAGNVTMARNYLQGRGRGMERVLDECHAMEDGISPRSILGLKRSDFWSNLMGDMNVVTCDRWHLRAALNMLDAPKSKSITLTPELHALVTEATRRIAKRYREAPAQTQAVIWCHVRGTGA